VRALEASILAAALAALAGCERSACETVCAREANCRLAASQGERMMGERKLPPDPDCMRRCDERHDDFMKCEGRKGECADLLACPKW
jgi:hypothetical protein